MRYIVLLAIFVTQIFAINYTDSTLPSTISLSGGQRTDSVTSTKSPQGWSMTTIGYNRNPHLSIQGTAGSQYALNVADSTTTFYNSGFSVASGIEAYLQSVHTLAMLSGATTIASGATFSVTSSGTNLPSAQGSEYGAESKVRFNQGASLILNTNAKATFNNANLFIHDGTTSLSQGANLNISTAKSIRFQNSVTNNGGTITLGADTYNVGGTRGTTNQTSTANFTSTNGNVTINGNFYNGGQVSSNAIDSTGSVAGGFNTYDSAFGGGGNLILRGGSFSASNVISTRGGDLIAGGGLYNPKDSSIGIYGATMKANVENRAGSTLTFGAYNGVMGQIQGNLQNSGSVVVDLSGLGSGTYTLITGSATGLTSSNTSIKNGNTSFSKATFSADFKSIVFEVDEDAKQNAINTSMLDSMYSAFVLSPFIMLDNIEAHLLPTMQNTQDMRLSVIASGASGSNGGTFGGLKFSLTNTFEGFEIKTHFAYLYGALHTTQDNIISQSATSTNHSLALSSSVSMPFANKWHFDVGANLFAILSHTTRESSEQNIYATMSAKSNIYKLALDSSISYDIDMNNITLSPYFSLIQSINMHQGINETSSSAQAQNLALNQSAFSAYMINLALGLNVVYKLHNEAKDLGAIGAKIYYDILAFNQAKQVHLAYNGTNASFNLPKLQKLGIKLGYQKDFDNMSVGVSGFFINAIYTASQSINLYHYGINGEFVYRF